MASRLFAGPPMTAPLLVTSKVDPWQAQASKDPSGIQPPTVQP